MPCEGVRAEEGRVLGTGGAPGKYKVSWASESCSLAQRSACLRWPGAALRAREEWGRQGARPAAPTQRAQGPACRRGEVAVDSRPVDLVSSPLWPAPKYSLNE